MAENRNTNASTYNDDSIQTLAWNEHIRQRPGMYVGLRAEPCRPLLCRLGVRLIDAVEHHDARLARGQLVEVGVAARTRDARVDDLAHRVHAADLGGDHAARFCHVSGEPAQTFQLHDRFPLTSFSKNRDG